MWGRALCGETAGGGLASRIWIRREPMRGTGLVTPPPARVPGSGRLGTRKAGSHLATPGMRPSGPEGYETRHFRCCQGPARARPNWDLKAEAASTRAGFWSGPSATFPRAVPREPQDAGAVGNEVAAGVRRPAAPGLRRQEGTATPPLRVRVNTRLKVTRSASRQRHSLADF